jgi:hypothetical protein
MTARSAAVAARYTSVRSDSRTGQVAVGDHRIERSCQQARAAEPERQ